MPQAVLIDLFCCFCVKNVLLLFCCQYFYVVARALQAEYDQLLLTHRDPSVRHDMKSVHDSDSIAVEAEMIAEAKHLSKHKTQLEVRMRILEDHNRQLEAQLQRLHLLLDHVLCSVCVCYMYN